MRAAIIEKRVCGTLNACRDFAQVQISRRLVLDVTMAPSVSDPWTYLQLAAFVRRLQLSECLDWHIDSRPCDGESL